MNINVGDRIKDNDPRMPGRVLTVAEIDLDRVVAKNMLGHRYRILRRRIFVDGKVRRRGFDLVVPPPTESGI